MINLFRISRWIPAFADYSAILAIGGDWIEVQKNAVNKIKKVNEWIKYKKTY